MYSTTRTNCEGRNKYREWDKARKNCLLSRGPFLESPENFSGPKLRPAYSVKLVFSHVVKEIKVKITATFRASRRLRFEDTKRIKSPEMHPKSYETFWVTRPRAVADRRPPVFAHHSTTKNDFSVSNTTIANHFVLFERTLQALSWYEMDGEGNRLTKHQLRRILGEPGLGPYYSNTGNIRCYSIYRPDG